MKYHLIFNGLGNLIGYTTDKKILEQFKRERDERTNWWRYQEVDAKNLSDEIKAKLQEGDNQLVYFREDGHEQKLLFEFEEQQLADDLMLLIDDINRALIELLKLMQYVKLDNQEEDLMYRAFNIIEVMGRDLNDEECCVDFEQYFQITNYLKDTYRIK